MSVFKPKYREIKNEITAILIKKVMRKKQEKKDYERPECIVHKMETETFICTSVTPNAPQTTEEEWENGGEVDGGSVDF